MGFAPVEAGRDVGVVGGFVAPAAAAGAVAVVFGAGGGGALALALALAVAAGETGGSGATLGAAPVLTSPVVAAGGGSWTGFADAALRALTR